MNLRKQSSTSYPIQFLMVDATDKSTPETGLTPTVTISKNGAAFGAASGAVTEVGNGIYSLAGNATDRNTLGELVLYATGTGADPVHLRYVIVPWDPFDATNLGLSNLDATIGSRSSQTSVDTVDDLLDTEVAALTSNLALVKTETDKIASIKTKTDNLPANTSTELSSISSKIDTVDDLLDTEVPALTSNLALVKTETDKIAAVKTKTDQLTFTVSNKVDATAELSTQAKADVNAEMLDALATDTHAELSSLPGTTPTYKQMIQFIYTILRNKLTQTSSAGTLYKNDGSTSLGTNAVSDDGTTYTKGRFS